MSASRVAAFVLTASLVLAASDARAGSLSLRAGAYTDADSFFVGIEYRSPVEGRLSVAPNFELVFPENGTYFSINGDLHYLLPTGGRLTSWVGGGLGIYMRDWEGGGRHTSVGANLIGGLGLRAHLSPYAQLKIVLKDDTEVVLGFGIRF